MITQDFPLPTKLKDNELGTTVWNQAVEIDGPKFLEALENIGAELTDCDPDAPTMYFKIKHQGKHFHLSADQISQSARIQKLATKNRMETIHAITKTLFSYGKDMFYDTVQNHMHSKKNFESQKDKSLNDIMFSIICDFLRNEGFRFHMS